jgi:uncharacterized protein
MTKSQNPFKFGNPVKEAYYLPRPELESLVNQFLANRIHVVLMGPRRFGKTSFVLNLLEQQERAGTTCLYLDIFNITSHRDFLQQLLRAIKSKTSILKRFTQWLNNVPNLRPKFSVAVDPNSGETSIGLSADNSAEKDVKELIQDVLAAIPEIGDQVIVAIDEFQKIAELNDGGWLEATLRNYMQTLSNTVFLFTGSRKSIISDMLNNPARPFYRSSQIINFPSLGPEFTDWTVDRFKMVGINAEKSSIEHLRVLVQDTPNYVQMACFHLVANGIENIHEKDIEEILKTTVKQNAYAYQTLLNTLTLPQQRALRLCAKENEQIFSKDLLSKYEIPTAAALASAIKALKDKQIIDESAAKGKVYFDDPLFAIWLQTEFQN